MPQKDIIAIGASAGGIEALKTVVADLPADLPASIFIVVHIGIYGLGILPEILAHCGPLPASNANDWQKFQPGRIYVAPPDHHLLLDRGGFMRITRGPKENFCRPAVDPLFRSAATEFGARVTGVVLTGGLDDGTAGLWAIKERGGTAIVQDPSEALAPSMPASALRHVAVDHRVRLEELAPLLAHIAGSPAEQKGDPVPERLEIEVKIASEDHALDRGIIELGDPSLYACPECHGVLLQLKEGTNIRFRCHTGHAYSLESLLAEFTDKTEDALWSAIRAIEETVILLWRTADELERHQHHQAATTLVKKAEEAQARANLVRQAVMGHEKLPNPEEQAAS